MQPDPTQFAQLHQRMKSFSVSNLHSASRFVKFPTSLRQQQFKMQQTCADIKAYFSNLITGFDLDENGIKFTLDSLSMQAAANRAQVAELNSVFDSLELVQHFVNFPAGSSSADATQIVQEFKQTVSKDIFVAFIPLSMKIEIAAMKRDEAAAEKLKVQLMTLISTLQVKPP